MWFARAPAYDILYMADGTYSYIRYWHGKAFSSDEVQQLHEAKDEIHTASPTVTSPPTSSPTTALPTTTHVPTTENFAPTSMPPTLSSQKFFVVSNFLQLQKAVALLTDNAIIEVNASIAVTETLLVPGGYSNVTIRSTQGNQYTLVSYVWLLVIHVAYRLIPSTFTPRTVEKV